MSKQSAFPTWVTFGTAGVGGIIGWVVVHPFNTAAVQMSLASVDASSKSLSFPSFVAKLSKERGIMSLYQGLSAGITRQIFYATSRFGLFEVFRDEVAKHYPTNFLSRLVVGCVSGGMAALISCPAEVSLVRMSNDATLPVDQRRNYKGVVNAFSRIISEEGPSAFFRGCGPFVSRCMLVGAVQIGTYDQFRATLRNQFGVTDTFQNVFGASMASGLIYSLVTMPLETAKNRMASQKPDPATGKLPFTGTVQTVLRVSLTSGVSALWRGFAPYYLRCGGHTVVMFLAVEYLRKQYTALYN